MTLWETFQRAKVMAVSGSWGAMKIDGTEYKFQGWYGLRKKCAEDPELFSKLVEIYWKQVG